MDKINIGFIGGCISKQPGITKDDNYTAILEHLLITENSIAAGIHTATYLSFDRLAGKARSFIAQKEIDIICIFIRPFPLLPLHKLLIKYELPNKGIACAVHPNLFIRKLVWPSKLTVNQSARPYVYVPKKIFSWRDVNIFTGMLLRLDKWAMKYLGEIFLEIKQACKENETKFILISPPKSPGSAMADIICKRTTMYFQKFCLANDIDYININDLPRTCFENDNIHVNKLGHRSIADIFHTKLEQVLTDNHSVKKATMTVLK